jgi:hypothetical protein
MTINRVIMIDETAVQKAYDEGFKSGLNWSDAWKDHTPGGPWVCGYGYSEKDHNIHDQMAAERASYLKGFEVGYAEKISTGRVNPFLGTDESARFHFAND